MKGYIAAGFDPARFWKLTPRLFALEMEGAALREKSDRAKVWIGAMLPHLKKPMTFAEYVDPPRQAAKRQSPEMMQVMFDALAAGWGAVEVQDDGSK